VLKILDATTQKFVARATARDVCTPVRVHPCTNLLLRIQTNCNTQSEKLPPLLL